MALENQSITKSRKATSGEVLFGACGGVCRYFPPERKAERLFPIGWHYAGAIEGAELHIEDEHGVGREEGRSGGAVAQLLGDVDAPEVADVHPLQDGGEAFYRVAHKEGGGHGK